MLLQTLTTLLLLIASSHGTTSVGTTNLQTTTPTMSTRPVSTPTTHTTTNPTTVPTSSSTTILSTSISTPRESTTRVHGDNIRQSTTQPTTRVIPTTPVLQKTTQKRRPQYEPGQTIRCRCNQYCTSDNTRPKIFADHAFVIQNPINITCVTGEIINPGLSQLPTENSCRVDTIGTWYLVDQPGYLTKEPVQVCNTKPKIITLDFPHATPKQDTSNIAWMIVAASTLLNIILLVKHDNKTSIAHNKSYY